MTTPDIAIPDLSGRLAVVTGASDGIGLVIATRLAIVPALLMLMAVPLIDLPPAYRLLSAMLACFLKQDRIAGADFFQVGGPLRRRSLQHCQENLAGVLRRGRHRE